MNISDYRENPTTEFSNIEEGEVFFSPETERFYLRMDTIRSFDDEERYNAVDLSDGCPVYFGENEDVEKVRADITIKNPY